MAMQKNSREEFEALVPDEEIRKFLMNDMDEDTFMQNSAYYVLIYQNVINLAFLYAFSCYLDLKNNLNDRLEAKLDACVRNGNSNSRRVIRTMQSIYKKYPLTAELMHFVLSDIHYDFIQGEDACLQDFFPNCVSSGDYWSDKGVNLNDYFTYINEYAESSRADVGLLGEPISLDVAMKYLKLLLGFFPFISRTSLVYDEKVKWYTFTVRDYVGDIYRGGIIDTFGLIRKFAENGRKYFFLSVIENNVLTYETPALDRFITCSLVGLDGEVTYSKLEKGVIRSPYRLPLDYETVMSYFDSDLLDNKDEYVVDASVGQLFNINYKYLKNLALSIADVIGKDHYSNAGKRLYEIFNERCPMAFENYNEENSNWDYIVVILLMEVGPSMVLQEVFYELCDVGDNEIVRNLRRRFGSTIQSVFACIKNGKDFTRRAKELLGDRFIEGATNKRIRDYNRELIAKAKTQLVLSALVEAKKSDQDVLAKDYFHTDTIQQHMVLLNSIKDSKDPKVQCATVEKLLSETFRSMICFYSGIFAYGEEKIQFENLSGRKLLTKEEISRSQNRAEKAFFEAAANKVADLRGKNAVELIQCFLDLCDECYRSEVSTMQNKSKKSRQLYAVLGRNSVMNRAAFDKIIDMSKVTGIRETNASWWVDVAISLLQFLLSGVLESGTDTPRLFNSVAPMVASYNNRSDSRDGYDTATFALIFDANEIDGKTMEIKMLSEFTYKISKRYYCLPNVIRSNSKWWIDPLVIPCEKFDKILVEG